MHGEPLRPEHHLRRPQHECILAAVQHVAQDHVHELVHEQRRSLADAAAHQIEIGGLQGPARDEAVAKREHQAPVLARIGIGDRRDLGRRDRAARIGEQRRVQGSLRHAGIGGRRQLRSRQIGLEELVADDESAAFLAVEQMMPAGQPEILMRSTSRRQGSSIYRVHCVCERGIAPRGLWLRVVQDRASVYRIPRTKRVAGRRSLHACAASCASAQIDASPGSSSPSTSISENARIGLRSPRGRSVRNASRMAPSSKVRRTATRVSRG